MKKIIFVLIFMFSLFSVAFASFPTMYLLETNVYVSREDYFNKIWEHYNIPVKKGSNNSRWNTTFFPALYNNLMSANCFAYGYFRNDNASSELQNTIYCYYGDNIEVGDIPTNINTKIYKDSIKYALYYTNSSTYYINSQILNNSETIFNFANGITYYILILDENGDYWEYSNDGWSVSEVKPPFELNINYDHIVNGTYINKRDYTTASWKMASINSRGIYNTMRIYFGSEIENPFAYLDIDLNDMSIINKSGGLTLNGKEISISSSRIQFNTKYYLNYDLYVDGNNSPVYSNGINFMWLPFNAIINDISGDSSDYSGDYNTGYIINVGSGDYDLQDNTNNIIDSIVDDSEVDNIVNEYLSGDINDISSKFGFTPLDNPFTTFLLHILESTYNALTIREPVILYANYNGMEFVLNSDDFITPESNIKTFVKSLMIFIYIYGNYKYFHYLITLVETARIDKAIAELGTDEFYDSDIM